MHDHVLNASPSFQTWIVHMGVHKLVRAQHQPFYKVLVEDGSERYAAEENLEPMARGQEDLRVPHEAVGRFFRAFDEDNGCYVPNEELEGVYPEDGEVRLKVLAELNNSE